MKTSKLSIEQAIEIIQKGSKLNKTEIKALSIEDFSSLLDLVREKNRTTFEINQKVSSMRKKQRAAT